MPGVIATIPKYQFSSSTGIPLANGTLTVTLTNTTTPTNTWQDSALTVLNTNPITLDSRGECVLWLDSAVTYRLVLKNSAGVTQWTVDNISGGASYAYILETLLAASGGSAKVGFLQAGTGAVPTTVQAKLRESVSVKDFGAVGDGVTNDTAAIVLAIAASSSVYFPPGTYKITSSITVPSNMKIFGTGAASILKLQADLITCFTTGTSTAKSNITISDLLIDGGGQTSNINTGFKGNSGIYGTNVTNFHIDNVIIRKMGIINAAAPQTDNTFSGMGILIEARSGDIGNIRITRCTVSNIAGGGIAAGDGINISGYNTGVGTSYVDSVVENCWVSTCGRHCYTVAGGSGETIPSGVKFINCYGEKTALDALDIEEGLDVLIDGCYFKSCGNDQTYYNPAAVFGATYRLLAAVAIGSVSNNITISNTKFLSCYYGITYAGSTGLIIDGCVFDSSTVSDITQGLAGGAFRMKVSNCTFNTALDAFNYNNTVTSDGFSVVSCTFAGTVKVSALLDGAFTNCTFKKGFAVTGGSSGFSRNKFIGCTFTDWSGIGLQCDGSGYGANDVLVESCIFYGTGNMTSGISFSFNSANRWKIKGCKFIAQTTAGINHANGNAVHAFDAYDNDFLNCAAGILVNQAVNDSVISGNTFTGVTGYCVSITNINSGAPMRRTSVLNNVAASGCVNGVTVTISTGTFDYCVIIGNNMNGCSGTKWAVTAGQNTNGFTVNNIIV
jgi:polygalacturonase